MRIAVAGFQHETNTFSAEKTELVHFRMADSWPAMLEGDSVVAETIGMNLPIAGAIKAAEQVEILPVIWCAAEPAGYVTDQAFDWVSSRIIDELNAAKSKKSIDAIYLDLHGAMVTESYEDGEGELLRRLRAALGYDIPIGVSLDLHANITPAMVDLATLMTVYRTYPHLDMADTGARCLRHLLKVVEGQRYECAFRQIPFLIPMHAQFTGAQPCQALYQEVNNTGPLQNQWTELALGFTASDIYNCGPSVLSYALSVLEANTLVDSIYRSTMSAKQSFETTLLDADEAVQRAMASTKTEPVIIADVQDNPGGGGTSDTTGLLNAMISQRAQKTVLGVICDPAVAKRAHELGINARFHAFIGARSTTPNQSPLKEEFRVLSLSHGEIKYTGEMYGGGVATLGLSCLVSIESPGCDVRVVVSSNRIQCLDQALFVHFGVDLGNTSIIGVKSTVHYRADFEPICSEIIHAAIPGTLSCKPERSDYRQLRPEIDFLNS